MALYGDGSNVNKTVSVSAGTYGGSNAVPVITVDSNERISAINTASITLTAAINANASAGDIGTYAFLQQNASNTTYAPGATLAGSNLFYSDSTGRLYTVSQPSGNWRCMGYDSGAALVNTGTGTGSGTGSGTISGTGSGNINVSGTISGTANGGNTTNQNPYHQHSIKGATVSGTFSGSGSGSNLSLSGTASVNVTVNSVTVNTTVAYSSTLWLRYA